MHRLAGIKLNFDTEVHYGGHTWLTSEYTA